MLLSLKKIIGVSVRVKKKQERFSFSHETYIRIIVIDFESLLGM